MVSERDELEAFVKIDAPGPERIDGESRRDRAIVANSFAQAFERFKAEARPILERSSVFVGAPVHERREELEHQVAVATVQVDDVKADAACSARRAHPVLRDAADVGAFLALGTVPRGNRPLATCDGASDGSRDSRLDAKAPPW